MDLNGRGESGQDHFAFHHCKRIKNGTFLDIGCNEPIRWNNTYALEEIGWRGLLIDLNPDYRLEIEAERKCPFICEDATKIDWTSLFAGRPKHIHYLSLDIDENEERTVALRTLENLFTHGISWECATVEHDAYRFGNNPRWKLRKVMSDAGYTCVYPDVQIGQYRGGEMSCKGNGKPFEDWWVKK